MRELRGHIGEPPYSPKKTKVKNRTNCACWDYYTGIENQQQYFYFECFCLKKLLIVILYVHARSVFSK